MARVGGIKHKESAKSQSHIKRRRVEAPAEGEGSNTTPSLLDAETSADKKEVETPVPDTKSIDNSNSSENSSSDDDDDDIEREQARLAQLRAKQSAGASSADQPNSGYNHDVLFRRADWRRGQQSGRQGELQKWKAVQNNLQKSDGYQFFMKKHFK